MTENREQRIERRRQILTPPPPWIWSLFPTVGVELEGFWSTEDGDLPPRMKGDCSVEAEDDDQLDHQETPLYSLEAGEIASPILEGWQSVLDFVMQQYPNDQNHTCGMHVHLGVTPEMHAYTYNADLWETTAAALTALATADAGSPLNHTTRERLRRRATGGEYYCRLNKLEEANDWKGYRYKVFNYSSFRSHQTLEVRVLPMAMSALEAIQIIKHLITTIGEWVRDGEPVTLQGSVVATKDLHWRTEEASRHTNTNLIVNR
jgi:hypothetical protein